MAQDNRHLFWQRENDVPEEVITYVDENVLAKLPPDTHIKGIYPHGKSYWTRTAKIETEQSDGSPRSFFLKVTQGNTGRAIVSGEFVSMTALHDTIPDTTPAPIAWGTYAKDSNMHFFLCDFIDMTDEVPDIQRFVIKVAELHTKGASPNGKYGFSTPTFMGRVAQYVEWTESWEEFFTNSMLRLMSIIEASEGPDPEFKELFRQIIDKVIPRLLRPLETGGRQIRPSLIHGDLQSGNVSVDNVTGAPILYDAPSLYAHNEWDLAPWGLARHKIGRPFLRAYYTHFPIAAPEEDQDDRNMLYSLRWEMRGAAIFHGDARYRSCIDIMRNLIEKFPEGYDGWARERGETPAPPPHKRSSPSFDKVGPIQTKVMVEEVEAETSQLLL